MEVSGDLFPVFEDESDSPVGQASLSDAELSLLQSDSPASSQWSSYSGSTTASGKCC